MRPPRHLAQLFIWMSGLGISDIETQLNALSKKWIQKLLNATNALWKNLMMYHQFNLILNYNEVLALFIDKNRFLGLLVTNIYKNKAMKNSLFSYTMLGYSLPRAISLSSPNPYFQIHSQTDNLFSIAFHPGIFQTNLLLFIRDLCRCLQPRLISSTTFGENTVFATAKYKEYINLLLLNSYCLETLT